MGLYAEMTFLFCWSVLCFSVSVWCTTKTGLKVLKILNQPVDYSRQSKISNGTDRSLQWIMVCTIISSLCFTIALLIWMPTRLIEMVCLGWPQRMDEDDCPNRKMNRFFVTNACGFSVLFTGYLCLLSVTFERLKMVFSRNTSLKPSQKTTIAVRSLIVICVILTLFQLPAYMYNGLGLAVFVVLFTMLVYPILSLWVSFRYFRNTRKLADSIDSTELSRDLLNVAVRLSIVSMTALSSSVFSVFISFMSVGFSSLAVLRRFLWLTDGAVNSFCLLGFFADAGGQYYYRMIFGTMHDVWLEKLIK